MVVYEPISLGHTCEVKYQLARALFFARNPQAAPDTVRGMINRNLGSQYFPRQIFDFQVTPFSAVCDYLERDFQGVFEREDLFVDPVTGHVTHRSLWTSHPHEFEPPAEGVHDTFIDQEYPAARAKFDYLAERFRRHLRTPGAFLYVFIEYRAPHEIARLLGLLNQHEGHIAHLLLVDDVARPIDLSGMEGRVFKGARRPVSGKAPDHVWEGDDAGWDAALAPFDLRVHDAIAAPEAIDTRSARRGCAHVVSAVLGAATRLKDFWRKPGAVLPR